MRKRCLPIGWPRRDPRHYRFPLPNAVWKYKLKPIEFVILSYLCCQHSHGGTNLSPEIIAKGLPPSAFMVYASLLLIEDRNTRTCHPSYNTIAAATHLTRNTVINSITVLLGKELIAMEHSRYFDQRGMKWKGNNLYTILPTQRAVDAFHQQQLNRLELDATRRHTQKRQTEYDRRNPRVAF